MPVKSEFKIQYSLAVAALDMRRHRATVEPGVLTRAVGVDGRFAGATRRFPGMRRLTTITFGASGYAISNVKFFKYIAVQKGNSAYRLRGFVIYAEANSQYDVEFHYYDSETTAWVRYAIETNIGATAIVDAAGTGKFLYYTRQGQTPKVVFWDTAGTPAMTAEDMGPGSFVAPAAPTTAVTTSGGVLAPGTYEFAYRYKDSTRNVYSGLSTPKEQAVTTDGSYVAVSTSGVAEATTNIEDFDTVEIYRTLSNEGAGSPFSGGVFFLAGTTTITDDGATRSWTYDCGRTTTDAMVDVVLAQQDYYDRILDGVTAAPTSGRVACYQGMTFLGGVPGTGAADQIAEVRWSPAHKYEPENFPTTNKFRLPSIDSEIVAFKEVGDYLFAITPTTLFRFQRVGIQLLLGRVHYGWGTAGRFAVTELDESLLVVGPGGMVLVNGSSMSLIVIGAVDRLINDHNEWAGSLVDVSIASDSAMGCTFVLNPTEKEMAVLWHVSNTATTLEDCNYAFATEGTLPDLSVDNDVARAFFILDTGLILYPDAYRDETKKTMIGLAGTVNGTVTSAGTTTVLTDSTATFDTATGLAGAYLHILSGDLAGESQVIASNTATAITVDTAFSAAVASGVRYSVAPIPFKLRYWPLTTQGPGGNVRDLFRRWKVTSIAVSSEGHAVDGDSDNDYWTVGMYRRAGSALDETKVDNLAIDANPANTYARVNVDGLLLEPGIEQMASNTEFELTAVQVSGTFTVSREVD